MVITDQRVTERSKLSARGVERVQGFIDECEENEAVVRAAARALAAGDLVALPTETVYGLAADASNPLAVRGIFEAKGRPHEHPLIVHVADVDAIGDWATPLSEAALALAAAFWPGPMTLILMRGPGSNDVVTGGLPTVGIRVPGHALTRAVLRRFGGGVAAPSANRFGHVSPTTAAHVAVDLGDAVSLIVDGGPCGVGIESTIIDMTAASPVILRPGAISAEAVGAVLGVAVAVASGGPVKAPGQLESHYAPRARVVVTVAGQGATERGRLLSAEGLSPTRIATIAMAPVSDPVTARVSDTVSAPLPGAACWSERIGDSLVVWVPADAAGYARGLYSALREADQPEIHTIVAEAPGGYDDDGELAAAIGDRLTRAAAKRRIP